MLFTNSNFYFTFQKNRGTTELDVADWESGAGEQGRTREVSYNMKINNPVGPKTSQVPSFFISHTSLIILIFAIFSKMANSSELNF